MSGDCVLRPTHGTWRVLGAGAVLYALASATGRPWLALGAAALWALPVVALLLRPHLADLEVERTGPGPAAVGDQVAVGLVVRNTGRRAVPAGVLMDLLPGFAPLLVALPALGPGAAARVTVARAATERRVRERSGCLVEVASPVGLVLAQRVLEIPSRVVVHPAPVRPPLLPSPRAGRPGPRPARLPLPGAGEELLGLRELRAGEPRRAVAHRASARHGVLLVREHQREAGTGLVVLVVHGRGAGWEAVLARAAALAVRAVRDGAPVVLLGVAPAAAPDLRAVLDALSDADRAPALTDAHLGAALAAARDGVLVLVAAPDDLATRSRVRRAAGEARVALLVPDPDPA